MNATQTAKPTLWLMMTLPHAVGAVLQARLVSTHAATQTITPHVRVMKTKRKLPCCGYEVDSASDVEGTDAVPKKDDATICLNCGAWLRFNKDLSTRFFDPDDIFDLTDDQLTKMRRATAMIRKRGPL